VQEDVLNPHTLADPYESTQFLAREQAENKLWGFPGLGRIQAISLTEKLVLPWAGDTVFREITDDRRDCGDSSLEYERAQHRINTGSEGSRGPSTCRRVRSGGAQDDTGSGRGL
jgi:hypothetical protein